MRGAGKSASASTNSMAAPSPDNKEWVEDCMRYRGKILAGEKAHWCADWDGLPVDETTPEFECCGCFR